MRIGEKVVVKLELRVGIFGQDDDTFMDPCPVCQAFARVVGGGDARRVTTVQCSHCHALFHNPEPWWDTPTLTLTSLTTKPSDLLCLSQSE